MLKGKYDFVEKDTAFETEKINLSSIDVSKLKLLVKAHEKEIYALGVDLIVAKPHRDNEGDYPFSKMDFLSHKLLEMIYPDMVPTVYAACFKNEDTPIFVLERIELDDLHKAYNVSRQRVHQGEGLTYAYDKAFLSVEEEEIDKLTRNHYDKVEQIKTLHKSNLKKYGITFDHSQVNMTWRNHQPVALELHKCQRDYLFDFDICHQYFNDLSDTSLIKEKGLEILRRMKELEKTTPKE